MHMADGSSSAVTSSLFKEKCKKGMNQLMLKVHH